MAFRVTLPWKQFHSYWSLWSETKKNHTSPVSADVFCKKLLKGHFLVLKNNFDLQVLGLYRDNEPLIMATHYRPKMHWKGPECLGAFAISPKVTNDEIRDFWKQVQFLTAGRKVVAPLNGHHYLGFSLPCSEANPKNVGILCSSSSPEMQRVFRQAVHFPIYRTYKSFETEAGKELQEKLSSEIENPPENFKVRRFSKRRAKKDLSLFNQLVNSCFTEHFDFCPLSDEENYDIMKLSIPLMGKGHFNFLEKDGHTIGFCMTMMDYHQIWDNQSDWKNILSLLTKKQKLKRARSIHIGIDENYRGQKLTKYLRHQTFLNLIKDGVEFIENSYIDEGNEASLANVQSTGARPLHDYHIFQINT